MRRVSSPTAVLACIVLLTAMLAGATVAQDSSPAATGGHPVVGSWLVDTDADDPANPPSSITFHADGTYIEVDVDGVGVGVWEPTGDRSAAGTFVYHQTDEGGAVSSATIRATIEVAPDGQSFSASYTLDLVGPDGTATGELGPGTATGTRRTVDPMGTPVAPLGPGPSPGASPVASAAAGIVGAWRDNNKACTLEDQRADNMWAAEGRADGSLGIESITLLPGQTKVFITDWRYEKRRNDGTNHYGSHLRLARVPGDSGPTHFRLVNVWETQQLQPGSGWKSYRHDLQEVRCPSRVPS